MSYYTINNNELYHHGIKGQKWGVRRFQNPDGSLTAEGKKARAEYNKYSSRTKAKAQKNSMKLQVEAYNRAADEMNNGLIDKYNKDWEKKHGTNYESIEYENNYYELFNKVYSQKMVEVYKEFVSNDKDFKKAKDICDKYEMLEWDEEAKEDAKLFKEEFE